MLAPTVQFYFCVTEKSIQIVKHTKMCEKTDPFNRLNPIPKHLRTFADFFTNIMADVGQLIAQLDDLCYCSSGLD